MTCPWIFHRGELFTPRCSYCLWHGRLSPLGGRGRGVDGQRRPWQRQCGSEDKPHRDCREQMCRDLRLLTHAFSVTWDSTSYKR